MSQKMWAQTSHFCAGGDEPKMWAQMSPLPRGDSDEEPDVADALFLPPCVLKARRGQPKHWAQPAQGWRPITEPPPVVAQRALPADAPKDLYPRRKQEQSIGEDHEESHTLADLFDEAEEPAPVVGETLDVDSEDDPFEYEVLSPEEAKAKTEIWDELNKDIAPMLSKKDSAAKRRQARQEDGVAAEGGGKKAGGRIRATAAGRRAPGAKEARPRQGLSHWRTQRL
ncbi:unnamed protein product [Effrenium voratum]|uniref:Brf1 TBP-binding domain-containing protein n=1 Tax=Effrenium voratum TaxID=2562239 RepID=A0AA36JAI9_9DINO|nr:unnamed protein product [Effrenium voratum]